MSDPGTSRDLNLVLYCLMGSLLAPLATTYLSFLSMKTVFLVAVTSARRMLELQALLANISSPFMPFHKDKVYLKSYPKSVPKIVSAFHLNQIIHLPVFFFRNLIPANQREASYFAHLEGSLSFYLI